MRDEVISDSRILEYIRKLLTDGATIKATDPTLPIIITDGNTIQGNLTITYPKDEDTNGS